ncbi:MAG: hypothetical protein Q4B54_13175 [Coriobacteriales bacterium]|nr:hypothetical protein [Coriobacteriales bacterium]
MTSLGRNIVAAGLAGALSLGMVACSSTSTTTTTTTVETTTTDEDGTTTTTSDTKTETTTTQDGKTSTTSSTTDHIDYANDYFHIGFNLPSGFTKSDKDANVKNADLELYATDDKGSEIWILLFNDITGIEGVTDEASWAKVYATLEEAQLTEEGETDIKTTINSGTIGDAKSITSVSIESKKDGKAVYRQILLTVDEENSGLAFLFKTSDQEVLKEMNDNLLSYDLV